MVTKDTKITSKKRRRAVREVAKPEEEALRDYEMVLIISPEVSEEAFEATLNNISKFIGGDGDDAFQVERWGKRKLAYPIGRFTEGNYILTRFKLRPSLGSELEAKLGISEEILRHLLIRLNI